MRMLLSAFALVAHLQLVMALSAVAYVQAAAILIAGEGASALWLAAAGVGTLGIYLLDGARSADREDSISQPARSALSRRFRASATILGSCFILLAGVCALLSGPSLLAIGLLVLLGVVGLAYLVPVVPQQQGAVTFKDQVLLKPIAISVAWLLGASLVGLEALPPRVVVEPAALLGFGLSTLPLLLLDSIWLDRRDMSADAAFERETIAGRLAPGAFQRTRIVLFLLALLGAPLISGGLLVVAWFLLGAIWLVLLEPGRLHSEAARVWLAALWRFTGLAGALVMVN